MKNNKRQAPSSHALIEAISLASFPMHRRDFYAAADAITVFLGQDTLAEQRVREFDALPESIKDQMTKKSDFGIYGIFHLASLPEVPAALAVIARQTYPDYELPPYLKERLQDPGTANTITTRFPKVTQEAIAFALNN